MGAAKVEDGAGEGEDSVKGARLSCFGHAAYAVVSKEVVDGMGDVKKEEVRVEAVCGKLLWRGDEGDVEVLENEGADGKKEHLEWERPVAVKKDSDLRRSLALSLMSLKKPR